MAGDLKKAAADLAAAKVRLADELRSSYDDFASSETRFREAVKVARDSGFFSWRELGEAIGRSHEYVRTVYGVRGKR
jgi:hypothetical protein